MFVYVDAQRQIAPFITHASRFTLQPLINIQVINIYTKSNNHSTLTVDNRSYGGECIEILVRIPTF